MKVVEGLCLTEYVLQWGRCNENHTGMQMPIPLQAPTVEVQREEYGAVEVESVLTVGPSSQRMTVECVAFNLVGVSSDTFAMEVSGEYDDRHFCYRCDHRFCTSRFVIVQSHGCCQPNPMSGLWNCVVMVSWSLCSCCKKNPRKESLHIDLFLIVQTSSSLPPWLEQQAFWPSSLCYWFFCFTNISR